MIKEIGSEFFTRQVASNYLKDSQINLLSGRTALDFIIKDIQAEREFRSVLLPDYCCESMVEPFISNGISVRFYSAKKNELVEKYNICDAVLLLNYFGYENKANNEIAKRAKESGIIVINDATHRPICDDFYSDYKFCSYRKWEYCNFAMLEKNSGKINIKKPTKTNEQYVLMRDEASKLKEQYLLGKNVNKNTFLDLYSRAETLLESDYKMYCGIPVKFDFETIVSKRINNAKMLIDGIKDIKDIRLLFGKINEEDTPMFVPILLEEETRNDLRQFLIKNQVYCPIHWPETKWNNGDIYKQELSLVCDQRYDENDIKREIDLINEFFLGRNK